MGARSRVLAIVALGAAFFFAMAVVPTGADATLPKSYGKCRSTSTTTTCVKVLNRLSTSWHQTGSDGEDNTTPQKHTLMCSIKKTQSYTWGVSVSASAEMKAWIFAKVTAQISGHFDKTEGSETDVSDSMPVPPHTTVHCLRGTEVQTWRVRQCSYTSHNSSCRYYRWHAPQGLIWRTTETHD